MVRQVTCLGRTRSAGGTGHGRGGRTAGTQRPNGHGSRTRVLRSRRTSDIGGKPMSTGQNTPPPGWGPSPPPPLPPPPSGPPPRIPRRPLLPPPVISPEQRRMQQKFRGPFIVLAVLCLVVAVGAVLVALIPGGDDEPKRSRSTTTAGKDSRIQSRERQCVVARRPSSRPAKPSSIDPVQTAASRSTSAARRRSQSSKTEFFSSLRTPHPPGTTRMSRRGQFSNTQ